ncbi:hypothetical protein HanIR_Chr14g0710961 [Helianthus annuus]|nr:hypothetical protein HanIR_Chr14g0710961 [Helianthus annuus]
MAGHKLAIPTTGVALVGLPTPKFPPAQLVLLFSSNLCCNPAEIEITWEAAAPAAPIAEAGTVPVPVAAMIEGSACCNNHWMVSPSDL